MDPTTSNALNNALSTILENNESLDPRESNATVGHVDNDILITDKQSHDSDKSEDREDSDNSDIEMKADDSTNDQQEPRESNATVGHADIDILITDSESDKSEDSEDSDGIDDSDDSDDSDNSDIEMNTDDSTNDQQEPMESNAIGGHGNNVTFYNFMRGTSGISEDSPIEISEDEMDAVDSTNNQQNYYESEQTDNPTPVATSSSVISSSIPPESTPMPNVSTQNSIPCSSNAFSLTQSSSSSIRKRKQVSVSNYLTKKISVDEKKDLDQILLNFIIKDFQPFNIVENSYFIEFIKTLNPSYKLPNRKTISKVHIPAMYEKCLGEMKELVTSIESACLTTDCWTSRNNENFIAITIHFVDSEFKLKSILLECRSFSLNHTGHNLSREIKKVLKSWKLENKITFAVSDNGYNIKNALNLLSVKNMECFAHSLNLIVQSALVLENDLLDRVKNIVSYFRRSTVANNLFKTYQINNGIEEPKKLIQDIQTRWNSIFYMIIRFVQMETSIQGTLGLLDNAPETLKTEEWTILQDIIKILKPFEEATQAISGQKYMTASFIIVIIHGLYKVYHNLLKSNLSPRVLLIVKKLLSNMDERDGFKNCEINKTLSKCTFLDPRFKHIPFMNMNSIILNTTKNEIIEKTAQIIHEQDTKLTGQSNLNIEPILLSKSGDLSIWNDIDSNAAKFTPLKTAKSKAIVEVQRYMDDAVINRNQDPLKWWKDHSYNFPNLSILAKNTLCHLGTSVPCERIFSSAGLVLNDRRCCLKSEKVNMLLFLHYNLE